MDKQVNFLANIHEESGANKGKWRDDIYKVIKNKLFYKFTANWSEQDRLREDLYIL